MAFLISSLDNYTKLLEELVNIDSGTTDTQGVTKVAKTIAPYFEKLGYETSVVDLGDKAGNGVFATNAPNADEYDLILVGHLDTVFAHGTAQSRPYTVKGNIAYGPGVSDMKSGDVEILWILNKLKEKNINIKVAVCLNPDEETGSVNSFKWIDSYAKKAKYALVFEGGPDENKFTVARKGISHIDIFLKGRGAHAGFCPELGRSAIDALAHCILRINSLANDNVTVNFGVVDGGIIANAVAENAHARIDVRFWKQSQWETFFEQFKAAMSVPFGKDIKASYDVLVLIPPMEENDKTNNLVEIIDKASRKLGLTPEFEKSGGVSDGNHISVLGTPVLDNFGPVGAGHHTDEEWLDLSSVEKRVDVVIEIAKQIAGI